MVDDDDTGRLERELDALLYAVSHDLRAPLRSLTGFTDALREEYGSALDPQGEHYLKRIGEAAETLTASVDGLLELSHVSRAQLRRTDLDLAMMVREAVERLEAQEPRRKVMLRTPRAFPVRGDADLLRRAVRQLVDNAWKFSSKKPMTKIEFALKKTDDGEVAVLTDHGVGFDPAHSHKLFMPFSRLHGDDYPGVGIGLVIAQRIIGRHGGWIRMEAHEEKGATISFTVG